jgi:hypothetical protein
VGNAGIIDSGDEFVVCFKVGTHDHPWALGPFGLDTLCWGCPVMPCRLTFGRHGVINDALEHDARHLAVDREASERQGGPINTVIASDGFSSSVRAPG